MTLSQLLADICACAHDSERPAVLLSQRACRLLLDELARLRAEQRTEQQLLAEGAELFSKWLTRRDDDYYGIEVDILPVYKKELEGLYRQAAEAEAGLDLSKLHPRPRKA